MYGRNVVRTEFFFCREDITEGIPLSLDSPLRTELSDLNCIGSLVHRW